MAIKKGNIDYLNSYGGSYTTTSIGSVIKDIIAIEKPFKEEVMYTYNSDRVLDNTISLFNTSSTFYKYFYKFLKIVPYRLKRKVFKTLNYKMIIYSLIYVFKKTFKNNKDLIIVYNGQPLIFRYLKTIVRPKKLIFICHGSGLGVYNNGRNESEILKYTDQIIALNTKSFDEIRLQHNNVRLIPNVVKDKFHNNLTKNEKIFIYIGRINENKRVLELCEIFQESFKGTEYVLKICGTGESDYFNETIKMINGSENIEFLGYLNTRDLKETYKKAQYIILISKLEGSPLCLNESYPYNVVPIGNSVYGTQDFIQAFGGIILPEKIVYKALKQVFESIKSNEKIPFNNLPDFKKQEKFHKSYFINNYKSVLIP